MRWNSQRERQKKKSPRGYKEETMKQNRTETRKQKEKDKIVEAESR